MRSAINRITIDLTAEQSGFTLVELCVVMVVLGILTMMAGPSYFAFRDRAAKSAAKANVKNAQLAVQSYYQDNGTYVTMNTNALKVYDKALPAIAIIGTQTASSYCISSQSGNWIAYKRGVAGDITLTACTGG